MTAAVSPARIAAAWGVHLLTASGFVIAYMALRAVFEERFADAFRWLTVAFTIDCFDGTLARIVGVKRVLPFFDGARLDDIVDYVNYVLVPIVLLAVAGLFPAGAAPFVAAAPLLASAYGFCRTDAKTDDHYFRGFPSYWNVVAFYAWALPLTAIATVLLVLVLSALVFAPLKFLYPSRAPRLRVPSIVLGIVWALVMIVTIWQAPDMSRLLLWASLAYPAYYVVMSLWLQATSSAPTRERALPR